MPIKMNPVLRQEVELASRVTGEGKNSGPLHGPVEPLAGEIGSGVGLGGVGDGVESGSAKGDDEEQVRGAVADAGEGASAGPVETSKVDLEPQRSRCGERSVRLMNKEKKFCRYVATGATVGAIPGAGIGAACFTGAAQKELKKQDANPFDRNVGDNAAAFTLGMSASRATAAVAVCATTACSTVPTIWAATYGTLSIVEAMVIGCAAGNTDVQQEPAVATVSPLAQAGVLPGYAPRQQGGRGM